MANPFGGSDEALTVNTGHTNYANLVEALIPRTTTKFRKAVAAADVMTGETGTYNSDGFWFGATTNRVASVGTISDYGVGSAHTIICAMITTTPNTTQDGYIGLFRDGNTTTRSLIVQDSFGTQCYAEIRDNDFDTGLAEFKNHGAGNNVGFGAAWAHNGSNAQKGFLRVSGSNVNYTGTTQTALGTTSSHLLNRIGVWATTRWGFQYIFFYNTYLPDADINAIIDNPAGVVSASNPDVTVAASGSAMTNGIGTQSPVFSLPL